MKQSQSAPCRLLAAMAISNKGLLKIMNLPTNQIFRCRCCKDWVKNRERAAGVVDSLATQSFGVLIILSVVIEVMEIDADVKGVVIPGDGDTSVPAS